MSDHDLQALGGFLLRRDNRTVQHVWHAPRQGELGKLLAFAGRSIDEVVNSEMAKRDVRGWYKMSRRVARLSEVHDLEKQWNGWR